MRNKQMKAFEFTGLSHRAPHTTLWLHHQGCFKSGHACSTLLPAWRIPLAQQYATRQPAQLWLQSGAGHPNVTLIHSHTTWL
jgi:hypothetical protein